MIQHRPIQPAELPWDPVRMDVTCDRLPVYAGPEWDPRPARRRYNITQELFPGGWIGFCWGDASPGSYAYALCILDRFLPLATGEVAYWRGTRLPCSPRIIELIGPLWRWAVLPLPWGGGTITGDSIRAWLCLQSLTRHD